MRNYNHISKNEIDLVISLYEEGLPIYKIAENLHRNKQCISKIIKDTVGHRKKGSWLIGKRPKNSITWDFNFFKKRTSEVAYWSGFICADGTISSDSKGVLSLGLAFSDHSHVCKFSNAIGLSDSNVRVINIKENNSQDRSEIKIAKFDIYKDLLYWGIVPRKTYNFFKPSVSKNLFPHFFRGYFDGNGYVSFRKHKERVRITGNKDMIVYLGKNISEIYGGTVTYEMPNGKTWGKVSINGRNQVKKVIEAMNGNPCLARKWDKINHHYNH